MPIYEYLPAGQMERCPFCATGFELVRSLNDPPVTACPKCGAAVKKTVSLCRAAVVEESEESIQVEKQVKSYEKEGLFSHAAELADKYSEKTSDSQLKNRAKENYKKAGYNISD